jgi:hypothetical protein
MPRTGGYIRRSRDADFVCRDNLQSPINTEVLFDTYFNRIHARPYSILDESSVRQRMQLSQLPSFLIHAISAVAARLVGLLISAADLLLTTHRYTPHPSGYQAAVRLSEEHATTARKELNTDSPSIDGLQALLLLVIAFTAAGKGRRAYMLMSMSPVRNVFFFLSED